MNKIDLAYNIAKRAHKNEFRRGGEPYIVHPVAVASVFSEEEDIIVALLHDAAENHPEYKKEIEEVFQQDIRVIDALWRLNIDAFWRVRHSKNVDYMDYIREVALDDIARRVKIADILHNLSGKPSKKKEPIYRKALNYLINYNSVWDEHVE